MMIFDFIRIDASRGVALWRQIYDELAAWIEGGAALAGTRLPSIREMAGGLGVSRSPVENAYAQLLIEGYIESRPKSGYFTARRSKREGGKQSAISGGGSKNIRCDFRAGRVDPALADIELWSKCLRAALKERGEIISRGEPCGEEALRRELSSYVYKARGVACSWKNIIVGSGTQELLSLLLRAIGGAGTAVIERPGFEQAERVLADNGWQVTTAAGESALKEALAEARLYMEISSKRAPSPLGETAARRAMLCSWARGTARLIVEDDYNGELRYCNRPMPAMQPLAPENIVYIGSFSQLLLPSVRIAYMALPQTLSADCAAKAELYDQTASKVEQLALAAYIKEGHLERHLRRSRKAYLRKSRLMAAALEKYFGARASFRLLETATSFALRLKEQARVLRERADAAGIAVDWQPDGASGELLLFFAATPEDKIDESVRALCAAFDIPSQFG